MLKDLNLFYQNNFYIIVCNISVKNTTDPLKYI